jgi:FMN-dependent NADH-azoreductase
MLGQQGLITHRGSPITVQGRRVEPQIAGGGLQQQKRLRNGIAFLAGHLGFSGLKHLAGASVEGRKGLIGMLFLGFHAEPSTG